MKKIHQKRMMSGVALRIEVLARFKDVYIAKIMACRHGV